jgi:hypothetical protein
VLTGRCLCGNVSYRSEAGPVMTGMCHCEDCQRQTASPFSVWLVLPADGFEVEGESLASYTTVGADSEAERERRFCGNCGSPFMTLMADMPQWVLVRAGTLDDRSGVEPQVEIWCDSAQPWVEAGRERRGFPRGLPQQD